MTSEKWCVIYLGTDEGYGLAQRKVSMLELFCRGMTLERAQEVCGLLNETRKILPTRQRA